MHFCHQEWAIIGLLTGTASWCCIRSSYRKYVRRVQYWWDSMTSIERRDIVWFWIWVVTVIGLSL